MHAQLMYIIAKQRASDVRRAAEDAKVVALADHRLREPRGRKPAHPVKSDLPRLSEAHDPAA
jgi:hypothetical protein